MKQAQSKKKSGSSDLTDNEKDKKYLKGDKGTLNLPDVKDIPGQEHVRPLIAGEIADTTISSADEEGKGILDTDEELADQLSNVSDSEKGIITTEL